MKQIKLLLLCILLFSGAIFTNAQEYDDGYTEDFNGFYMRYPEIGGDITLLVRIMRHNNNVYYTEFKLIAEEEGQYYMNFYIICPRHADGTYAEYNVYTNDVFSGKVTVNSPGWQGAGLTNKERVNLKKGLNIVSVSDTMKNNLGSCPSIEYVRMSKDEEYAKIPTVSNEPITVFSEKVKITSTDEEIQVKFDGETPFDVTVYNMQGAMVVQRNSNHSEATIPLNGEPRGIYVVRVKAGDYKYSQKVVK